MARFKGHSDKRAPGPVSREAPVSEGSLSIIAKGMVIVGDLKTQGVVKVEGEIRGTVQAERQVLVSAGGRIEGDVVTREAIIGGEVKGSIVADERVEIQAASVVSGDITTKRIVIVEGGEVNGSIHMGEERAQQRLDASVPKAVAS